LSRWYDVVAGSSEQRFRDLGIQKLNARPGERLLEIGFGTGHCLITLAQAVGPTGKITGLDISEKMRDLAQARVQATGLAERVELRVGDAAALSLEADSLDGVFMSFTLELFDTPEIPIVLSRCYTALRPNGRLALVTLVKQPGVAVSVYEWFHTRLPSWVDCRPIHAQADLRAAGFRLSDVSALLMWGLPVEIILAHKDL
jgi:demethylmenaquinone methyltransferase/2-methoxy-6-polyprenyl-1,4-benzoquinol methylase